MKVTALLVSHNGSRWLPNVLSGLEGASLVPDAYVAVDTGSTDDSADVVASALGISVVRAPETTAYGEAVRLGLEQAAPAEPDEWVWLLHDDSSPAPDCLAFLEEAAREARADVAVLGPKIREWPSLKRLLEVGVTLSGTGARETGLERGEYDQGQHDQQHDVLAVNTAGMLVRREVLEQLGFDPLLPVFGNDLDFGWRAARAGHTTQVVPDAVIFHVEAARRGLRESALVAHPRREERISALRTLLVNEPAGWVPFRIVRTVVGCLLRALGLLLVRAPGEAADEMLALGSVLVHPGRILAARRTRGGTHAVAHKEVRHLLAPFWLPYRHGLDFVSDVGVAVADTVRESAARRRDGQPIDDRPLWLRLITAPGTALALALFIAALVAARGLFTGGPLHGGALLPAPDGVGHWWSTWAASRHDLNAGTDAPGPAYLLPLALLATMFLGSADFVVAVLFVLVVPLAFLAALRFFRRLIPTQWAPLWAAVAYALLPVLSGAVAQGRLGTVAGAILLPVVARSALGLSARDEIEERRGWRAAWRTGLGLGLLVMFVPAAWLAALVLAGAALLGRWGRDHGSHLLVILLLPLAMVLPWALATDSAPGAWLVEAGKAAALPTDPGVLDLALGRAGGPGAAPAWISAGLVVAALLALLRADTRDQVVRAWVVAASAAVLLTLAARVPVSLPGVPADFRPWPGFLLLVLHAALVAAAALAASGVLDRVTGASFSWRQPVAGLALLGALLTPVVGAGWWLVRGGDGPVDRSPVSSLPQYMTDLAAESDRGAVLVLTGGPRNGIEFQVLRSGPLRLGDDAVLALTEPNPQLGALVESLLSARAADSAAELATYGVRYVYAPAPVSGSVSGGLDSAGGFAGASASDPGSRAWRVEPEPTVAAISDKSAALRPLWLTLQLLAILTGLVLAAPERLLERTRR